MGYKMGLLWGCLTVNKLALLLLLLLPSPAMACESYEECMGDASSFSDGVTFGRGNFATPAQSNQTMFLKAIAYKLDEISKKLDKQEVKYNRFYIQGENADTAV